MKFEVYPELFEALPNACFGVVTVKGVDNTKEAPEIEALLAENIKKCEAKYEGKKVKEQPEIVPYREAFRTLGINPNKFMCSIEALLTRIAKGKGFPHINAVVDLGNAVSIQYDLPRGAHDTDTIPEALCVRAAKEGDHFTPFGSDQAETPDVGEMIYASGQEVRTRRWTWRQSEIGKITEETKNLFFPIDGFTDINKDKVLEARDALADLLKKTFDCQVEVGFVDKEHPVFSCDL